MGICIGKTRYEGGARRNICVLMKRARMKEVCHWKVQTYRKCLGSNVDTSGESGSGSEKDTSRLEWV